jgi:ABC-type branched-subunit amino acid transport system substrate-binding protein
VAAPLTAQEERGKQIYFEGLGSSDEGISAFVGPSSIELPASALPCGNCHGYDGLGRPEGGVEPSVITWKTLTKAYGHTHRDGRVHPAFDEESLAAAIAEGIDPAGNALDSSMPRYALSSQDMADLIAYLKRLGTDFDPGLSESVIRVGSVFPKDGPLRPHGEAARALLKAYFDDINAKGGIYGRKIELDIVEDLNGGPVMAGSEGRLFSADPVFAVVSAFAIGRERELFPVLASHQVPVIGPVTLFAGHTEFQNDLIFHVLTGLVDQARALAEFAALELGLKPKATAVILPRNPIFDEIAEGVRKQGDNHDWPTPIVLRMNGGRAEASDHAAALHRSGVEAVFYFGPNGALPDLAAAAVEIGWTPHLFLSGLLSNNTARDLPPAFHRQAFLAYPLLPTDQTPDGLAAFMSLRDRHDLSSGYLATQASVYAAAQVFVEGLRRSGRGLSRTRLVAALEGLSNFETGITYAVSFGPNRRVGALGAHVMPLDLERRTLGSGGRWMRLD